MRLSIVGFAMAGNYAVGEGWVVMLERAVSSGGWITLGYMGSFLITIPVAGPASWLGMKLDFDRDVDAAVAVGGCAVLV